MANKVCRFPHIVELYIPVFLHLSLYWKCPWIGIFRDFLSELSSLISADAKIVQISYVNIPVFEFEIEGRDSYSEVFMNV